MSMDDNFTGIQHIGIPTNDIEATIAFYQKLGFIPVLRTVNEQANEKVAFLRLHNLNIETYENRGNRPHCDKLRVNRRRFFLHKQRRS